MAENYLWKSSVYKNVTGCNNKTSVADILRDMHFLCDTIYTLPEAVSGQCS